MTGSKAPKRNRSKRTDPAFEKTRQKIQASQIINRLCDHILKDIEMKPTQVTAALGLLKKTLPDLSTVEMDVEAKVDNITRIELVAPEDGDGTD